MSARTKARKRALDVLFEADQRGRDLLRVLAERVAEPGTEASLPEYSVELVEGYAEHRERIDEAIESYSQGWPLDRMPAVDRALVRLATWELVYSDEVPDGVVLSEAVDLAKELSTDDSPAFVNGLLARLAQLKDTIR